MISNAGHIINKIHIIYQLTLYNIKTTPITSNSEILFHILLIFSQTNNLLYRVYCALLIDIQDNQLGVVTIQRPVESKFKK